MRPDLAPGGTFPDYELRDHLWHDLRAVTSEIRPDWDLSTPGLREAWDAGNRAPFHGWNQRPGQEPAAV